MIECEKIVEHSDRDLNDALIVIATFAVIGLGAIVFLLVELVRLL